jgi:hypothetical protein
MNLFYVFDEYTDVADAKGANHIRNIIMDALRDPQQPRPEGELLIGEMTRECVLLIFSLLLFVLIIFLSILSVFGFALPTLSLTGHHA